MTDHLNINGKTYRLTEITPEMQAEPAAERQMSTLAEEITKAIVKYEEQSDFAVVGLSISGYEYKDGGACAVNNGKARVHVTAHLKCKEE